MNAPIKNKCAPMRFGAVVVSPFFLILVSKILQIYLNARFFFKVLRVFLKRRLALEFDAFIFIIILWKCFREAKIGSFSVIAGKMVYFALKWRFSPRNRCAYPRNGRLYRKWRRFLAISGAGLLNRVIYTLLAYSKM